MTCPDPPNDKQTLLDIDRALDPGTGYFNWGSSRDTENWNKATFEPSDFDDSDTRVLEITITGNLPFSGLRGTIPAKFACLDKLEKLILTNHFLSGTIPTELGSLSSLQILSLGLNDLSGTIPTELGNLSSLQTLQLENNNLSGTIPTELGNLSSLQILNLGLNNSITGTIPPELGNLSSLQTLDLSDNILRGTIPTELSNLSTLIELHLNDNLLTGDLPDWLGDLTRLALLWLDDNDFVMVSEELDNLTGHSLRELSLWGNERLTWENPISNELARRQDRAALKELYQNASRENWTNSDNWLFFMRDPNVQFFEQYGELPSSGWYGIETNSDNRVIRLNLSGNGLRGRLTNALEGLSALEQLDLSNNRLTSRIPPEIAKLSNLEELRLNDNRLSPLTIPPELGNLSNLVCRGSIKMSVF